MVALIPGLGGGMPHLHRWFISFYYILLYMNPLIWPREQSTKNSGTNLSANSITG